jgi:hypothetical protein
MNSFSLFLSIHDIIFSLFPDVFSSAIDRNYTSGENAQMGWKWFFQEAINFILEIESGHGYSRKYE